MMMITIMVLSSRMMGRGPEVLPGLHGRDGLIKFMGYEDGLTRLIRGS